MFSYNKDIKSKGSDRVQKIYCDLSRICEIEDAVVEWYDIRYFQKKENLDLAYLLPLFKVKAFECAGVDGLICRVHMTADKVGCIPTSHLGMTIKIKEQNDILVNEVKRVGLMVDRYVDLELRVGDQLVLYYSRTSA